MNLVLLLFILLTFSITISGSLFNLFESKLPIFFVKLIRYGKFNDNRKVSNFASKLAIEVPKSWFRHFYCLAVLIVSFIFYQATSIYVFNTDCPEWLINFLNYACGTDRKAQIPAVKVYTALVLLSMQVARRFYDTHFVSVFSKNAKMNLAHYLIGLIHYPGCVLAILCEAPKFANTNMNTSSKLKWSDFSNFDALAIFLFVWAWWHQHVTTRILSDLRKDKNGNIVTDAHKIPNGDWFNFLSCPHQTAEILMYFAITILLWGNLTWSFVFLWVLSNQVVTILLSHKWYQSTFKNFPKNRKALIPFVY